MGNSSSSSCSCSQKNGIEDEHEDEKVSNGNRGMHLTHGKEEPTPNPSKEGNAIA